ncbi:MAG: acetolactate synthase [Deltaproteobacteria bacterium]|nr:acetolactate synthase [Deltaproteobacteria bacterium]MBQ4492656.1 acetolactate synthase [Deltaproteobacteria bacterium]MBQ7249472.1 acetolactate synthase [Deltaproteobacteria bacterium]MBR5346847.1 acetolactate synthase [Deltaproteobacteria bacterium]
MAIKQISVFLENKPGTLLKMTGVLAENKIDMRALSLAETKDFGIVRLIVDDVYTASTVLKDKNFISILTDVVGVLIPDEPGGLDKVLRVLAGANINVEYMYAFLGGRNLNRACMIFRVGDSRAAESALGAKGIKLLSQEEIATF